MMGPAAEEIDSLSLLAHKVGPCVFDLSSYQTNVSIRDQIVRAQHLVSELKAAHKNARSLLIVGMGAAGMSAALAACEAGYTDVRIVDTRSRPFSLFRGLKSRFVGPYMYEWPSEFYRDQSYPSHPATPWQMHCSSPLNWSAKAPLSAHALAISLERKVKQWCKVRLNAGKSVPTFITKVDATRIKGFIQRFARIEASIASDRIAGRPIGTYRERMASWGNKATCWNALTTTAPHGAFSPDYVIVAAGMGKEQLHIAALGSRKLSPSFWKQDKLKETCINHQRIVVVGGGDGAIQDSLRALTQHDHPLTFIAAIEKNAAAKHALERELPALLSADRQLRQHTSWSQAAGGFSMVDNACRDAAQRLAKNSHIKAVVLNSLKPGRGHVFHLVRDAHFGKAYLLNRFVIYLLSMCVSAHHASNSGGMAFTLGFNVEIVGGKQHPPKKVSGQWDLDLQLNGVPKNINVLRNIDHIVVRFGVLADSIPGPQMIHLSPGKPRQLTTLKRVELPFVAM